MNIDIKNIVLSAVQQALTTAERQAAKQRPISNISAESLCNSFFTQFEESKKKFGSSAALRFMGELLDSVETLTGIADEHGAQTLADLMYLQEAILEDGFIDNHPDESKVLEIVQGLPSGEQWAHFIRQGED